MRTFIRDGKYNFVDEDNTLVGFDANQLCRENFGYFLSRTLPTSTDDSEGALETEGFKFDTTFFYEQPHNSMVVFRLTNGAKELFLTLFNVHNGYYSHNFLMNVGGEQIHYGYL